jgi:spoIIIJ-associated protein
MDQNEVLNKAVEHVKVLLNAFNLAAEVSAEFTAPDDHSEHKYILITLMGDGLNELVGFHGKNMEALQTVISLMLSREYKEDLRILLEVNDYREKREKYLQGVAQRASLEVQSTGQNVELPPMKPYERRVIHMFLKGEEGIQTESLGEGEERRILIKKV